MNIKNTVILGTFALLVACGDKEQAPSNGSAPKINASLKETPKECFERSYKEASDASEKELRESGEKGPFTEGELVPQGVRMMIQEDCGLKE